MENIIVFTTFNLENNNANFYHTKLAEQTFQLLIAGKHKSECSKLIWKVAESQNLIIISHYQELILKHRKLNKNV